MSLQVPPRSGLGRWFDVPVTWFIGTLGPTALLVGLVILDYTFRWIGEDGRRRPDKEI